MALLPEGQRLEKQQGVVIMETTFSLRPQGALLEVVQNLITVFKHKKRVVKSCYFLASDKWLWRSCQFWFHWGRMDWGRRMGISEAQPHIAPQTELMAWR